MKKYWNYKEIISELVKREIKARYKQSALGYAWVLLVPLINLGVLSIVFSYFVRIPTGDIPYPIFLFAALVPWTFTANAISYATSSLLSNSNLITKIGLPREVFPISSVVTRFIDFSLSFLVLIVLILIFGLKLQMIFIYLVPIVLVHVIFVLGVSFILSAINVFYRDVENVLGVFLTLWMYLTPVIYPLNIIPSAFSRIIVCNPMVGIIDAYRKVLLFNSPPDLKLFGYSTASSVLIVILGFFYFKRKSRYFADVI